MRIRGKEMVKILHYGLQRSGTNFLESLLRQNYRVKFLNSNNERSSPLQKHFRLYDRKDIIPEPQYYNNIVIETFDKFETLFDSTPDYYLVISKDPYSWYLSYVNWAKRCNWPKVNHHYIEEYNLFYGKFLELSKQTDKIIFVKYIDLLKNTDDVLNQLEKKMNLKSRIRARSIRHIPNRVSQSSKFTQEKRFYYINEEYIKEYTQEELELLNKILDQDIVFSLGYKLIEK